MSKTIAITRLLASVALVLAYAVAAPGVAKAASPTATPTSVSAVKPPAGWVALKASFDANHDLRKTVSVSGTTRTITYTSKDGLGVVLQEPVAGAPSNAVRPMLSLSGCGWFQVCIVLNHHELVVISAGGGSWEAAMICLFSAGIFCAFAAGIVAAALAVETEYGICPNGFQIEVYPIPLAPWSVGCW